MGIIFKSWGITNAEYKAPLLAQIILTNIEPEIIRNIIDLTDHAAQVLKMILFLFCHNAQHTAQNTI
jgi:hypothetical protein